MIVIGAIPPGPFFFLKIIRALSLFSFLFFKNSTQKPKNNNNNVTLVSQEKMVALVSCRERHLQQFNKGHQQVVGLISLSLSLSLSLNFEAMYKMQILEACRIRICISVTSTI